jgi:hypothetical protein
MGVILNKGVHFSKKFFLINIGDCPPYFGHFVIYKGGYRGEGVVIPMRGGVIHRGVWINKVIHIISPSPYELSTPDTMSVDKYCPTNL